ncbi:MAG: RAD55 family ATPase [Bacteroidetes bacterium]|nr:RAD55 family ATPase [Bacteroidota bacterium]
MTSGVRLISSGFKFIDKNWGGVYRSGSYLVIGQRKTGRTLLGLQFALEAAKQNEVCLFFTNMRPKDLMIQAASLNFDIQSYMNQNLIIVVRVAPPNDVYSMQNPDEYLVEYLNDIVTVVNQYNPSRIIFDELTPYIGFRNIDLLKDAFLHTLETIEEREITSLFIIGDPATPKSKELVDVLASSVTGLIYLRKGDENEEYGFNRGKVTITPNVGHTEGRFSAEYRIEPYKGVTVEVSEDKPKSTKNRTQDNTLSTEHVTKNLKRTESQPEPYSFSNVYNHNDFSLILNNQIALYKSTGQIFNLVSFRLDPAAQVKGLLSINQLQNAVRLATTKRDKICVFDNKVIILLVRSNQNSAMDLMSKLQEHLPSADQDYITAILGYISIFNVEVDEGVNSAETMLDFIQTAEGSSTESYTPINNFLG